GKHPAVCSTVCSYALRYKAVESWEKDEKRRYSYALCTDQFGHLSAYACGQAAKLCFSDMGEVSYRYAPHPDIRPGCILTHDSSCLIDWLSRSRPGHLSGHIFRDSNRAGSRGELCGCYRRHPNYILSRRQSDDREFHKHPSDWAE